MSEPDGTPAPAPPVPPYRPAPWSAPAQPPAFAQARAESLAPPLSTRGPRGLGMVAFLLAVAASVIAPVVAAVAAYQVGRGTGTQDVSALTSPGLDWSLLTPVREWVAMGEVAFWAATALGTWALVQGIIAIAKDRGRGWGVAAVVMAVLGPLLFGVALVAFFTTGLAASIGG